MLSGPRWDRVDPLTTAFCLSVLQAMRDDSDEVPGLLTDYILQGEIYFVGFYFFRDFLFFNTAKVKRDPLRSTVDPLQLSVLLMSDCHIVMLSSSLSLCFS